MGNDAIISFDAFAPVATVVYYSGKWELRK